MIAEDLPDPIFTNFDVSSKKMKAILKNLDVTNSRGPDNIPAYFVKQLAQPLVNS